MFILPSLWEDPGFVLVEAGYMNLTILSSDCPNGPKELLNNQKNGFLFKINSIKNFIENFEFIENSNKNMIKEKKISFKKKIKEFTLLCHYKIFRSILLSNEN
jgi:glycosyltransferase involved in cell wall biosynthesis